MQTDSIIEFLVQRTFQQVFLSSVAHIVITNDSEN